MQAGQFGISQADWRDDWRADRTHLPVIDDDLVIEMRAGGESGLSDEGNRLAGFDLRALLEPDGVAPQMRVSGHQMIVMPDADISAVTSVPAGLLDYAIGGGKHWRSEWRGIVHTLVELPHTKNRMYAPTEPGRDAGIGNWLLQCDKRAAQAVSVHIGHDRSRWCVTKDLMALSSVVETGIEQVRRRRQITLLSRRSIGKRQARIRCGTAREVTVGLQRLQKF